MEDQPPLPPVATHPLFKNATPSSTQMGNAQVTSIQNYSSSDAPKTAHYPQQNMIKQQPVAPNPWDREEREKELEIRREHIRQWRDQQIVELSLLPSRSSQQEEQLKTLVLERDFERRAMEEENEEENDVQYQKGLSGVQEVLRLQPNSSNTSQITAPTTRLKQVDIKVTPTNISPSSSSDLPSPNEMQAHHHSQPPLVQPKSILKSTNNYNSNPSSPSKHGKVTSFAPKIDTKTHNLTEITMNNTNANQMLSQLSKEMGELSVEYGKGEEGGSAPPPPPERGNKYFLEKISDLTQFSINYLKVLHLPSCISKNCATVAHSKSSPSTNTPSLAIRTINL